MKKYLQNITNKKGSILVLVVVFTGVFITIISGLLGQVYFQSKLNNINIAKVQAIHIAEAGVNYYRWHLAHDPTDYTDNSSSTGPYIHTYQDPESGLVGTYSLEITPPPTGSSIVTVRSTGWVNKFPNIKKTIEAQYGSPSLAKYSFLTNSDIWIGENEAVSGPMHSNGGIRMDGTNDALVTSAKETYTCKPEHGCNNETKPGVWGSGPNNDLWEFPKSEIDFNHVTIDMANMKTIAQNDGHYYRARNFGYHLVFNSNGTYDLWRVTRLRHTLRQIDDDDFRGCENKAERIRRQRHIGNYNMPNNGIIFIDDDVWVEGTVKGKVTLVSAHYPESPTTDTSIFINGNLKYLARDGTNKLGLIAQKNIQVPRHAPNNLTIDGVLFAQKGRVYRALYCNSRRIKNSIEVYGGILTNKVWTWTWVNGSNNVIDGYRNTNSIFDSSLNFSPPPHFPTTGNFELISWEDIPQ